MLSVPKLDLFEYEPDAVRCDGSDEESDHVLDDVEIEQLLLSSVREAKPVRYDDRAVPMEGAEDGDGLGAMRGIMVGLVLVVPFWGLIVAALVRA